MILSIYWKLLCLSAGAKNQLHPPCFSEDWLTAFWPINREPEFCQIWDWWWNINNNISFHFRLFPRKLFKIFNKLKKFKKIILGPIWALFAQIGQKWIFMEKRALPVFKYSNYLPFQLFTNESFLTKILNWWMDRQQWFYRTLCNQYANRLICKYLSDHLPGNNSLSSDQQLPIFNTDKDWPHFNEFL